ncbi:RNA-directed DNA polymerase, eukaryota [Tanacetum coccineum]
MADKDKVLSEDPFNLYDILNKRNDSGDDLKYPPDFTPSGINVEEVNKKVKRATSNEVNEHANSTSNKLEEFVPKGKLLSNNSVCSKRVHTGGSILQLMVELVNVGQTMGYNMEWCNLGGILCVWEPTLFVKYNITSSDNFLAVMGTWVPSSSKLLIISVYAPQDLIEKRVLWNYILHLIDRWDGDCVIIEDFNEVRMKQERYGSVFNVQGANAFNSFISLAGLIDLTLDGYAYTWAYKTANKTSKLDRFLVAKGLMVLYPYLLALCLDRNLSDHRPILMRELSIDYGPTLFRFFPSWFNLDGFDKMIKDTWKSLATISIQSKLFDIDKILDQGSNNEEILSDRSLLLKELNDINSIDSLEDAQKSRVRWAIEGNENTKFFHGILNSKRSQLAICGTLIDDEWIVDPLAVKSVFLKYFSTQFSSPVSPRICLADQFTNRLSLEQQVDLERSISNEEIKSALWDCRMNKSPGPDGFTFEFFCRY